MAASSSRAPARPEPSPGAERPPRSRRLGLDRVELAALVALAGLSVAVLAALASRGARCRAWTACSPPTSSSTSRGSARPSEHGLIGNRFDLAPGARRFLHPGLRALRACCTRSGSPSRSSYLAWKPVAVVITFVGCLLYVRRLLPPGGRRQAALVLALFASCRRRGSWPGRTGAATRASTCSTSSPGEMWTGQYLWGYLLTAIAVFLMPLVLLAYERWRGRRPRERCSGARARRRWWSSGSSRGRAATLALIVLAVEAWRWSRTRERPPLAALAIPAATALPAIYYFAALPHRPRLEAGRRVERRGRAAALDLAVVGDRADRRCRSRCPPRSPTGCRRRAGRSRRCGSGRSRRWRSTCCRSGRSRTTRSRASPCRSAILAVQGVLTVWPRPRPAVVVALLVAADRARASPTSSSSPRNSIPDDVYPYYDLRRRAPGARLRSSTIRGRAACSAPSTPATWSRTRPAARRTSARSLDAGLARAPAAGRRALRRAPARRAGARVRARHATLASCSSTAGRPARPRGRPAPAARAGAPLRLRERLRAARAARHGAGRGPAGRLTRARGCGYPHLVRWGTPYAGRARRRYAR